MGNQKCTIKQCKYPVSCEHNNMCMEREMQKSISNKKIEETSAEKVGVLLCHGFLSDSEQMSPFSDYIHELFGWETNLVELTGHGYDSDNITKATWHDWVDDVKKAYLNLESKCDKVYVIGFSLGGCVSAYVSTLKEIRFDGLVLINCPFGVKNVFNKLLPGVMIYNKICKHFDLQKIMLECITNHSEMPEVNQPLINLSATNELRKMSNVSKTILESIVCPVLQIQEYNDPTVFYSSGVRAFKKIGSSLKQFHRTKLNTHLTVFDKGQECSVFCVTSRFLESLENKTFMNIAHRGASGNFAENTLQAFEEAIKRKCDMIELDVQLIGGELRVFHDDTAERMFGLKKRMQDLTKKEVNKLVYANCEKIPTLKECLDLINGRCHLNIEIKDDRVVDDIVKLVHEYQNKESFKNKDIVLSSFNRSLIKTIRNNHFDIKLSQLFDDDQLDMKILKEFKLEYFDMNLYSINISIEDVSPNIVSYCNENNIKVFVFTVNELKAIRFLREIGVNGVFTDYPRRIQ